MASVTNILPFVRKWEGGLVYHKGEGQWTNRGVQWTTYQQLAPKLLGIKNPNLEEFKKLSSSDADKFIVQFWNTATDDNTIKNQAAANAFFEMLWGGSTYGIKWIQKVLGVYPDGSVGPKTVAAANNYPPNLLLDEVLKRYKYLAKANPSKYKMYINGWVNRWNDLYAKSKVYFTENDLIKEVVEDKKKSKWWLLLLAAGGGYLIYKNIK